MLALAVVVTVAVTVSVTVGAGASGSAAAELHAVISPMEIMSEEPIRAIRFMRPELPLVECVGVGRVMMPRAGREFDMVKYAITRFACLKISVSVVSNYIP